MRQTAAVLRRAYSRRIASRNDGATTPRLKRHRRLNCWTNRNRRDQHDSTASVTDVALFADCPRRYYLARYLKFEPNRRRWSLPFDPDEQDGETDATTLGTQVHRLLAGAEVTDAYPEAHRLAQAFHDSRLGRRAARASRIEREWDFLLAIDDVVLSGQIDLWFEEAGELVLVDYKTDQVDIDGIKARAAEYAPQLWLYTAALQRATGPCAGSSLHLFRAPGRSHSGRLADDVI